MSLLLHQNLNENRAEELWLRLLFFKAVATISPIQNNEMEDSGLILSLLCDILPEFDLHGPCIVKDLVYGHRGLS